MVILGLNAYHGDSSACIVVDGKLVAAVEEERFTRIKHWAGLPAESVKYCLAEAGMALKDIDHIALNRNPRANTAKKALFTLANIPSAKLVSSRIKNALKIHGIRPALCGALGADSEQIKAPVHNVEHHMAHMASSYYISPFDRSAVVSVDGYGDFVGAMWGIANGNKIDAVRRVFFPHSLGLFYLAFTQYLGFMNYGDEYKVMGLAAYGEPEYIDEMRKIVPITADGGFTLDLHYFTHHRKGEAMSWECGEPKIGPVFSKESLERLFGPARKKEEPLEQRHKNIAASLQKHYEEVFFHILHNAQKSTGLSSLALAGGCAMNALANGKIFSNTQFKEIYIQPAAGDAGGAIGAAYYVWNGILGRKRSFVLEKPYLGPEYGNEEIELILNANSAKLKEQRCSIERVLRTEALCREAARAISEGKVVGWFQGRMEWGPRALGNRSIVCDPRLAGMKDILNLKIKRREPFRPFASSIHIEALSDYFETGYPDPFMVKVYKIRQEKRGLIPAIVHVDGTGRLQTVRKQDNPKFWQLIEEFRKISGTPILLNTSFNENEPVVCTPGEALDCFLRTRMDVLVLNDFVVKRMP